MKNTISQDREAARRKLDAIATQTPEQLDKKFSEWPHKKIADLWNLLEKPYRQMCRGFGLASSRQRMSARGQYTQNQMRRLAVLQRHAAGMSK